MDPRQWHESLATYQDFGDYLKASTNGTAHHAELRLRMAQNLWVVSVEDCFAIGYLVKQRLLASARSLIRPQFEALARGAWLSQCASPEQIGQIAAGQPGFPRKLSRIIESLMESPVSFSIAGAPISFRSFYDRMADSMNDLTHRGTRVIGRRMVGSREGAESIDADEPALFLLGTLHGGLAAAAMVEVIGQSEKAQDICVRCMQTANRWVTAPTPPSVAQP